MVERLLQPLVDEGPLPFFVSISISVVPVAFNLNGIPPFVVRRGPRHVGGDRACEVSEIGGVERERAKEKSEFFLPFAFAFVVVVVVETSDPPKQKTNN